MRRHDRLRAHIPVRCPSPPAGTSPSGSGPGSPATTSRRREPDAPDRLPADLLPADRLPPVRSPADGSPATTPGPTISIEDALSAGLARIGEAAGLEPLAWRALDLGGDPLIEGAPPRDCADRIAACEGWARLLQLEEYTFDVGDGVRTWFRCEGDWQIEVTTSRE